MFERGYRQRLETDLVRWVTEGVISGDAAQSIRKARLGEEAGSRLPGAFAMLGALMLAASVSAFVAANWQDIPRLVKLVGILLVIAAGFLAALQLDRRGMVRGADAAATFATLCFGAGVALVGQMYHLPADWPAGAMLVAIGALIAAALTGKNGPLIIAFAAMIAWSFGRVDVWNWKVPHWSFLLLLVPGWLLALGRNNRLVSLMAVAALSFWLASFFLRHLDSQAFYAVVAAGLAIAVIYMAVGLLSAERGGPQVLIALVPIGAWGFGILLCAEVIRVLESSLYGKATLIGAVFPVYGAALLALVALFLLWRSGGREKLVLIAAFGLGLCVPLLFLIGFGHLGLGRIVVSVTVLASAVALIAGGILTGYRTFMVVGYAVFGVSLLILLWRTIGTLLDQSLFFLLAGMVLLGLGVGARKLTLWTKRVAAQDAGRST
jgi:uncharacterized membrane protein